MSASQSLVADLKDAIDGQPDDQRAGTLWRLADLFIQRAERLNEQQVELFDDVLYQLVGRIEGPVLAKLSGRLGPIQNAPIRMELA